MGLKGFGRRLLLINTGRIIRVGLFLFFSIGFLVFGNQFHQLRLILTSVFVTVSIMGRILIYGMIYSSEKLVSVYFHGRYDAECFHI